VGGVAGTGAAAVLRPEKNGRMRSGPVQNYRFEWGEGRAEFRAGMVRMRGELGCFRFCLRVVNGRVVSREDAKEAAKGRWRQADSR